MRGAQRVLVFCTLITFVPAALIIIPLYLRHIFYADVAYATTESDIMEINDGISTIFCSEHTLRMNSTFNAFQMSRRPEVTSYRKHIRLKKSMSLPDDTLEYWGFYLLKNATVSLSVCSRFQGASILVVKGERNLHTCGLLEHNINKEQTPDMLPGANRQVKIIYESDAQEIDSNEIPTTSKSLDALHDDTTYVHEATVNTKLEGSVTLAMSGGNNGPPTSAPFHKKKHLDTVVDDNAALYLRSYTDNQREYSRRMRHAKSRKTKSRRTSEQTGNDSPVVEMKDDTRVRKMRVERLRRKLQPREVNEEAFRRKGDADDDPFQVGRVKRSWGPIKPPSLLDQGIKHGGNADKNFSSNSREASSVSSFESDLFNCYGGAILLAHEFEPSDQCTNVSYLINGKRTKANHHVAEDGYYYYIFYSDNDIVSNDIYALFDIYKPTFQYENVTKSCINRTECTFSLSPFSADRVIVEIPTRDGIEHDEADDISILISVCQPRMAVYTIFPMALFIVVLGCAFI